MSSPIRPLNAANLEIAARKEALRQLEFFQWRHDVDEIEDIIQEACEELRAAIERREKAFARLKLA